MSEREEFVARALERRSKFGELCGDFAISRKTGYKWLGRYEAQGVAGLEARSRRPRSSPRRTEERIEALVCELRGAQPVWGGRKIRDRLVLDGVANVPAPATVTDILARHGLLAAPKRPQRDLIRFEAEVPNDLWQMDFKGFFTTEAGRCHPLTILDDHSRFNICLAACPDQKTETVQRELSRVFALFGMPRRILVDNGPPWGSDADHQFTRLTAWLIRLGILVSHGRPYHPQTQGKEERFHRTLKDELLSRAETAWQDLAEVQRAFDLWRDSYNFYRPHQALGGIVPASRYSPSARKPPTALAKIEYPPGDQVRLVQKKGRISFRGKTYLVGRAFVGQPVALRATSGGPWDVYYCQQKVARLDPSNSARV